MTSVVPERSAPIMMTGRSLRLTGILRGLEVADPGEEVEEGPGLGRLEAGVDADFLQDRLAAVAAVEQHDGAAQLVDLVVADRRRGDEWHVGQVTAARDHAPTVLLPGAAHA